ncbi:MAG: GHKL domain-containing protein [Phaeodactylibacter sp.]|nr:GHKL domain-containing protein [Phaeodactylibacter sp.]MCB9301292.1 GHKL domain-containing protein [Lewinellaceae bacterium]
MKTDHYERYIRESAEKTTKVGFYGAIIAIAAVLLFYSLDIYDLKLGGTLPWRAWGLFCAVSYLAMRPFLKSPKQQLLAFALMMAGLVAMMNGIAYLIFTNLESTQRQEYAVTAGSIMLWLLISMVSFGSRPYVSWAGGALMAVLALFLFFEGAKSVGFIMTIFMAAGFSIWAMRQQERQEKEKSTILYELEEREEKIARQRQELQNANENLVSFNYAITHDLKGPLRLAQSFAQLLERRIKAGDMEGLDEFFLQIKGSIGKVFQIIDDLLLLSRIGKGGLELEEVELEDMIRKIWEEQTADDSREKLTLRFREMGALRADPKLLWHIFTNLISNAVKYTRYEPNPLVEVGMFEEEDSKVFYVKDNGAGFDKKFINDLGKPFKRLHSAHQFEGTGIGLAIVRQVVHLHQGRFWADGAEGEGATFYCSFPNKIILD